MIQPFSDRAGHRNGRAEFESSHIFGDVFEAFIGAIYLDIGYQGAKDFLIKRVLSTHVDIQALEKIDNNFKSQLIEWGQKNKRNVEFDTQENPLSGQNKPPFLSIIRIDGQIAGKGEGYSKKEAQQNSASKALENFDLADEV